MKKYILSGLFVFQTFMVFSKEWLVGASRTYQLPSQVSTLVSNGDTVSIDAGTYTADVSKWTASNLLLRGVGGRAVFNANNTAFGRKGIFVITGNNSTVENIEFANCHDVAGLDKNWAGIRFEASGIKVSHCYFHDNDTGILDNGVSIAPIIVEYSEFKNNGRGDGFSHNIYINHSDTFIFRYNYVHLANIGHEVKSRATINYILYNRISNESTGIASREIDLPNGGQSIIMGNIIQQGANSTNWGIIGYGLEGLINTAPHHLYLVNNTIINNKSGGVFVDVKAGTGLFKSYNTIFAGSGNLLTGSANMIDTMGNLRIMDISTCGFVDANNYNYELISSSILRDKGVNAGVTVSGYSLTPNMEYRHPNNAVNKDISGAIDIGAFEYIPPIGLVEEVSAERHIKISPNPFSTETILYTDRNLENALVTITNSMGQIVRIKKNIYGQNIVLQREDLPNGLYFIHIMEENQLIGIEKMVLIN